MARVHYIGNDILVQVCQALGITGYVEVGGRLVFNSLESYDATKEAAYNAIYALYDDEDPDNDVEADQYLDTLEGLVYEDLYWSDEGHTWL